LHDFKDEVLDEVGHRPWLMPEAAWIMTQTWHDLLFAHWPIDAALIAAKIPAPLEIDLFDGQAWIGIVPFRMTNVTLRGVPALPWISAFPELNVRTYVRAGDKAGVYFFSLDAGNPLAVRIARTFFHLPYYSADMTIARVDGGNDTIHYTSRRRASHAELVASYRATGPVFQPRPGSIEYFLTERYCLYIVDAASRARRLEIHHPPWALQEADAQFERNAMTSGLGIQLPSVAPLLHFAKRQDMVGWALTRAT
jgi:hypothetical protein